MTEEGKELVEHRSRDLVAQAEEKVRAAARQAEVLRTACIALTYPEDWVIHGGKFGYLQDKGAQRVAPAWGIELPRTQELVWEEQEVKGHFAYMVAGTGRCQRTEREEMDIGGRSTADDLYAKQWAKALELDDVAAQVRIRLDVRKAALANLHGRLIRKLTGLNSVPVEKLKEYGVDTSRCTGVTYQSGTKQGTPDRQGGSGISDAQVKKIVVLVTKERRVMDDKGDPPSWRETEEMVREAQLSSKRASQIIEGFDKMGDSGSLTFEEFEAVLAGKAKPKPAPDEPRMDEEGF
jgi:hypothetical protein